MRRFLWDDVSISLQTAREVLQKNEQHFKESDYGLWKMVLSESGICIGYTGLWYFFDEVQPQLLYALLKPYSGQGFATEGAQLIVDYCFRTLGFQYLVAATDEGHQASQKVALRLGMHFAEERLEDGKSTSFYRIDRSAKI